MRLALFALAALALLLASLLLPVERWALELIAAIRDLGAWGWAVFVAAYLAATVLLIPASVLTLGAGFVYGFPGAALVWPAAVAGALLAFAAGRRLARDFVAERLAGRERFQAVDQVVGDSGLTVVLLLRLSPLVPFGLLNYFMSLTRIRLRDYLIGTAAGIVPGMFLYVYLGTSAASLAALAEEGATESSASRVAFWVGLAATAAVTLLIARLARRRIEAKMAP